MQITAVAESDRISGHGQHPSIEWSRWVIQAILRMSRAYTPLIIDTNNLKGIFRRSEEKLDATATRLQHRRPKHGQSVALSPKSRLRDHNQQDYNG
jgi:hypothetical protein